MPSFFYITCKTKFLGLLYNHKIFRGRNVDVSDNHRVLNLNKSNKCGVAPRKNLRPCGIMTMGAEIQLRIFAPKIEKGSKCYR